MSCNESQRTQGWLDGELQGDAAREAEHHVENCADCQALAADTAFVSDALRGATRHQAPDLLRARVRRDLARENPARRGFWTGVASGGGGMALAAALALFAFLRLRPRPLRLQWWGRMAAP